MSTQAIFYSVIAGIIIELFFRLIKYRDALNRENPRPISAYGTVGDASNYMTVSQYLSGGNRRWLNYFLFRLLPPALIFILLVAVLSRYLHITQHFPYLLVAATISLIPRDFAAFFKTRIISEKLLHFFNMILVVALVPLIWLLGKRVDLSFVAPSIDGLIDNLWSNLLIAMLVLFYLRSTNMGARYQDQAAEETALSNYVVSSYTKIRDKYAVVIEGACAEHLCSKQILYAVLIYENMNRPNLLRSFENWLVRLFHLELTVGIAQVKSDKPLSDEESIQRAAKILEGSIYADSGVGSGFADIQQLEDVLKDYNSSKVYAESVAIIITKLRVYANELFLQPGVAK